MDSTAKIESTLPHVEIPAAFADGATVLVVGTFDPSANGIGLRLLARYGETDDVAPVVTTLESADDTAQAWERIAVEESRPSIGVLDTTSEEQSIEATYGGIPKFFTPSSGDLERIVVALSELSGATPPRSGSRHLVIRSLTPIVEESSPEGVHRVLQRVGGLRTGTGLALYGVDVTAHDRETLTTLAGTVDGVLWVSRTGDGQFDSEFHRKRRHVPF